MNLTTYEYIWAVCGEDPNDGYPTTFSYWSDMRKAEEELNKLHKNRTYKNCKVVQTSLMRDNAGNYYKVKIEEVIVDPPTRGEVLAKLSPKDRKVLGL